MFALGYQDDGEYIEHPVQLEFADSFYALPNMYEVNDLDDFYKNNSVIYLGGDDPKCVTILYERFYHTFMQTLGIIFQEFYKNKKTKFYLLQGTTGSKLLNNHVIFLVKILKKYNIDYKILDLAEIKASGQKLVISNFTYIPRPRITDTFVETLYKVSLPYQATEDPFRKVYVSRKMVSLQPMTAYTGLESIDHLAFKDDKRVSDEDRVEQFFAKLGFEIVHPEDFETFEDQIKYFSSVKTLVSITSAGLINMCFMKEGSTVLELSTPLLVMGELSVHTHYQSIAWAKRLLYVSFPSLRDSDQIIEKIKQSKHLMEMMNE